MHPFISDKERDYLDREIGNLERNLKVPLETPWKSILTSTPVLALIVSGVRSPGKCVRANLEI